MRVIRLIALIAVTVAGLVVGLLWTLGLAAPAPVPAPVLALAGLTALPDTSMALSATTVQTTYMPLIARNFERRLDPNDPLYVADYQWALEKVRAPQAWFVSKGHAVTVAVVDTGVELSHADLASSLWVNWGEIAGNGYDDDGNGYADDVYGWDFVDQDGGPWDGHGHGTHVAGIVGAATDNAVGVAGLGWGVTLMPVRVLDAQGEGTDWTVSLGIRYAVDNGAQVVNLSLGGSAGGAALQEAVEYAQSKGALVIAAAGNWGTSALFYPAAYDGVIGVSATDSGDQRAWFSNYGSYVDIAAPGVDILSTKVSPVNYGMMDGTSMATPLVSGLAALIWTEYPAATSPQVWAAIRDGADDLGSPGWDVYYGWGRINAERSLYSAAAMGGQAAPPLPAPIGPASDSPPAYRPGEVVVSVREGFSVSGVGLSVLEADPRGGAYLVRVPPGGEVAAAQALQELAGVVYAHPNHVLSVADP